MAQIVPTDDEMWLFEQAMERDGITDDSEIREEYERYVEDLIDRYNNRF